MVMGFITFPQSTQNADGIQRIGLIHHDRLETTFQCFVLFKIFLVLFQGCSSNGAQFSPCQSRFQNVGSVHGTLCGTGTHQGVDLINEQHDLSVRSNHLLDHTLQPLLKLSAVFGACHQCPHVQ